MKIISSAETGIAPVELTLLVVEAVVDIVRWLWLFGDGSQSTEQEPKHVYNTPGIYSVSCTVWDEFGNQYDLTKEDYIYVYDYTIGEQGLLSGTTDFCFKHAVTPQQGQGITPIDGMWVWPILGAATARAINSSKENISLVINAENMKVYRIGIPECWVDREGDYDEAEIASWAFLPEISSRYGDHENVRIVEVHVAMRSWDERNYRGIEGFDSDGFKTGHTISLELYANGKQSIPEAILLDVQRNGDYSFYKEVEAKRFQLKLNFSSSPYRCTRAAMHCQEIDHRTPPQLNDTPELQYQREFAIADIWFSRNRPTANINRADGTEWEGAAVGATGPDGKSSSAFVSTGLSATLGYVTSDFTISGWMIGNGVLFHGHRPTGEVVEFRVAAGVIEFTDGVDLVQYTPAASTAWRHIAMIRSGSSLEIYESGVLRLVQEATGIRSYGGGCVIGNGTCFDIRRVSSRAVTENAMQYYYNSVIDGGGGFLP